jgi:hypothetical protein
MVSGATRGNLSSHYGHLARGREHAITLLDLHAASEPASVHRMDAGAAPESVSVHRVDAEWTSQRSAATRSENGSAP